MGLPGLTTVPCREYIWWQTLICCSVICGMALWQLNPIPDNCAGVQSSAFYARRLVFPQHTGGMPINSMLYLLQYKYQINIDGTVAAYRLPYLLAGNSIVLKQDSIYYEHFYNELKPWKHYIPFKNDLSDLLEKLQWAKEHDTEVQMMLYFVFKHIANLLP